jgi:hypothetical protein
MEISNNTFIGVKFNKQSLVTINTVAEALLINAEALKELSKVFTSQHIQIDAMLKVEGLNSSINDISIEATNK